MKHLIIVILIGISSIFIGGCADELSNTVYPVDAQKPLVTDHLTMEEARMRLQKFLGQSKLSKSICRRNSTSCFDNILRGRAFNRKGKPITRAEEDSAYYYVFDIDNNGGYAIMGARFPLPELLAICSGSNHKSQATLNEIEKNGLPIADLPNRLPTVVQLDSTSQWGMDIEEYHFFYDYDNISYSVDFYPLQTNGGKESHSIINLKIRLIS